ncbi:MAG: hypothetical protein ACP5G0_10995 [Desulfomonilia bacterium]
MRDLMPRLQEYRPQRQYDDGIQNMCDFIEDYLEILTNLRNSFRRPASDQDRRLKAKLDEDIQSLTSMASLLYALGSEGSVN